MTAMLSPPGAVNDEPPAEDIEALLDLDDDEFTDVVSDALFHAVGPVDAEPDWQCLFHNDVIKRTRAALVELKRATEGKLTEARKSRKESAYNAEQQRWNAIELRLRQVKDARPRLSKDEHVEHMERQAKESRNAVRLLTLAIQRHRLTAIAAGLTPEPADQALWATLDEVEIACGSRMVSLTELLGSGSWAEDRG